MMYVSTMLQTTRRNYPVAMQRPSWKNRGKNFSDLGVLLECGKRDLTTVKNVLHYVTTGSAKFMFNVGKELFFVPVVMVLKVNPNQEHTTAKNSFWREIQHFKMSLTQ